MEKRLYRTEKGKVWAGIFSGMAEYFDIDPVLLRIGWVAFMLGTGVFPGLLFYLIAWLIIPKEPIKQQEEKNTDSAKDPQ